MMYVLMFCRCLLALVFLASAVSKAYRRSAFDAFVASIRTMGLVAPAQVRPVAVAVVATEAAVPVLLLLAPPIVGFAVAAVAVTGFTLVILHVLRRGLVAPCRCFGASEAPLGYHHVARNVILLLAAVIGTLAWLQFPPAGTTELTVVSLLAAGFGALIVVVLDDIASLFRRPSSSPYR